MLSEERVRIILKWELAILENMNKTSFGDTTKVYGKIMILMDVLEIPYDERQGIIENGYKNFKI